jgi:NADPH-dependent 2,4-dienoyl-CoA reductase/sulfur reductase-like enzyme
MHLEGMDLGASLDIAVVGGGIAGLAAALYLQQSGHRITVCFVQLSYSLI